MSNTGIKNSPRKRAAAQAAHTRRKKRRRRGRRTIHFTFLLLFVLAAGTALSLTIFFKIEDVMVVGCDKYPPDDIAAASGIEQGDNLLRIDKELIQEKLTARFPYVDAVNIRRKLPARVELEIVQSTPDAAIAHSGGYLLITREGKVLEQGSMIISPDIPIVKGLSVADAAPGDYLDEENAEALLMLERLSEAVEETGFKNITNVDLTNIHNMKIAYEGRIDLLLGSEADLSYKLDFVSAVLDMLDADAAGVLNAAEAALEKKIIFSPAGDAGDARTYEDESAGAEQGVQEIDPALQDTQAEEDKPGGE